MSISEKQRLLLVEKLARGVKNRKVSQVDVVARYLSGQTVISIAAELGVKTATIYWNLKAAAKKAE